jgi:K+ potassium transporter
MSARSSTSIEDLKPVLKRRPVRVSGLALILLSFQTLGTLPVPPPSSYNDVHHSGIIYSDIGTSPLYVLNGIWSTSGPVPPKEDVVGGISAIIWSLTLLPLCKYVRVGSPPLSTEAQHYLPNLGPYLFALWYT